MAHKLAQRISLCKYGPNKNFMASFIQLDLLLCWGFPIEINEIGSMPKKCHKQISRKKNPEMENRKENDTNPMQIYLA